MERGTDKRMSDDTTDIFITIVSIVVVVDSDVDNIVDNIAVIVVVMIVVVNRDVVVHSVFIAVVFLLSLLS